MRWIKSLLSLLVLLSAVSTGTLFAASNDVHPELTFAIQKHGDVDPHQRIHNLVFTDEDIVGELELGFYRVEEHRIARSESQKAKIILSSRWWEKVQWDVRTSDGVQVSVLPRLVGDEPLHLPGSLTEGQHTTVRLSLGRLSPADYWITVKLPVPGWNLPPAREIVSVRGGHEDSVIERTYLRALLAHTKEYGQRKKLLDDLTQLEPRNVLLLEQRADESIGNTDTVETVRLFQRAISAYEANIADLQRDGGQVPTAESRRYIARMTQVIDLLPAWAADRSNLQIRIDGFGTEKRYLLVRTRTGEVLRKVE